MALLGPAASLVDFRPSVKLMLRVGPHLPRFAAKPTLLANFGGRYRPDPRFVTLTVAALKHFRYQERAVVPSVFSDTELQGLGCRTLLLIGEHEIVNDPHEALEQRYGHGPAPSTGRARRTIPGVEAELVPEAGHLLNMERPEVVDSRLVVFLPPEDDPPEDDPPVRARRSTARPYPLARRISMAALRAGRSMRTIHGLVEIDVTDVRRRLAVDGDSMTAFIVASVARVASGHAAVRSYRDWRGRIVTCDHVDITTMVEVSTVGTSFPLAVVVRDADVRTVSDITGTLRRANDDRRSGLDLLGRLPSAVGRLPGFTALLAAAFRLVGRTAWGRDRAGTVAVTAVGMLGDGGGFGIAAPTIHTVTVVVGGISRRVAMKPTTTTNERKGDSESPGSGLREILHLTVSCDHLLVDGGPMARFVSDLRRAVESGEALGQGPGHSPVR